MLLGTVYCQQFARTDLAVELKESLLIAVRGILLQCGDDLGLIPEHIQDLLIRSHTQRADQHGYGNLAGTVNAHVEYVIGICLILKPGAAVGDNGRGEKLLAELVLCNIVIDTGRTNQLADDNTFRTVDDKCACVRHDRQIAHINLLHGNLNVLQNIIAGSGTVLILIRLVVTEQYIDIQRCSIGRIALFTFIN